ncbi:MAG: holin-like protein [Kiritimatiellia bacterium]|jgi:holin-like protein
MLYGFFIIMSCQLIGELMVLFSGFPVPGAILGMIILFVGLSIKGEVHNSLDEVANVLIKNLGLLFVPAGAGVSSYTALMAKQWDVILIASVTSTVLTLLSCAWIFKILDGRLRNVQ